MLNLKTATSQRWVQQVLGNIAELLIDHAHCERKAASTAMNLIGSYCDHPNLVPALCPIVTEELEHFRLVLDLLRRRGIPFRRQRASNYGSQMNQLVRQREPGRAIDRLLVAGLIEARSCERFGLLQQSAPDRELAEFYGGLFESEARHHAVYLRSAMLFGGEADVKLRLAELAGQEAEIIARGDVLPRMHS